MSTRSPGLKKATLHVFLYLMRLCFSKLITWLWYETFLSCHMLPCLYSPTPAYLVMSTPGWVHATVWTKNVKCNIFNDWFLLVSLLMINRFIGVKYTFQVWSFQIYVIGILYHPIRFISCTDRTTDPPV